MINYEVLFRCCQWQELINRIVGGVVPDFVILDVKMPRKDGYETASWLMTSYPDIRILALSMDDEEAAILRMLKNGARGYIFKDAGARGAEEGAGYYFDPVGITCRAKTPGKPGRI